MVATERSVPTKDEVLGYLSERRNWGRWGDKGSAGAMNLIDEQKRLQAVGLVEKGRTVSLSRPFPVTPNAENPRPAQHYMQVWERPGNSGAAVDYYGIVYHGTSTTHIDALCHVWDENGMWDGRKPEDTLTFEGAELRHCGRMERRHPYARRAPRRSQASRQALCYRRRAGTWLGA